MPYLILKKKYRKRLKKTVYNYKSMIYECECCRYVSDKKGNYDRHLLSKKHNDKNIVSKKNIIEEKVENDYEKVKNEIRQPTPGRTDMVITPEQIKRLGYNKEKVLNELREEENIISPISHIDIQDDIPLLDQLLISYYVMSCLEEYDNEKFKYITKYNTGYIALLFDKYTRLKADAKETLELYGNTIEQAANFGRRAIMAEVELEHLKIQIEKAKASRNQSE
jgi:hypothetical protein